MEDQELFISLRKAVGTKGDEEMSKKIFENGIAIQYDGIDHKFGIADIWNAEKMEVVGEKCANDEGYCLVCSNCGRPMFYLDSSQDSNGRYICTLCGRWTRESTMYKYVNKMAEEFRESYYEDYIPEGCAACGGPWPNCKDSCSLYDE